MLTFILSLKLWIFTLPQFFFGQQVAAVYKYPSHLFLLLKNTCGFFYRPTASDRLTSPLLPLSRNTLLPPISAGDPEATQSGQHSKPAQVATHGGTDNKKNLPAIVNVVISFICSFMPCEQRQKGHSSRAHSAINDEAGNAVPRDRHHLLDIFSRPNTTHTYRVRCPPPTPHHCHRWYAWSTCWCVCFPPSRTLHTAAPSQCWTTSGRDGQAEPLWPRVRNSTWLV